VAREAELLRTEDAAYAALEARYLDGHRALFPDVGESWDQLVEMAERLAGLADDMHGAYFSDTTGSASTQPLELHALSTVDGRVSQLVDQARVTAFELLGERDPRRQQSWSGSSGDSA
jgi:hypothetical protein